jgi:hypothetical protein
MQIVDAIRNAMADAINTDIDTTNTAFARFYDTGLATKIATIALDTTSPFSAASSGAITLDVTPAREDASPAAGTVGRLGLYQNSTDAAGLWRVLFGVATATGADVTMSNLTVATTDTVQLTSLVVTVPAGTPTLS